MKKKLCININQQIIKDANISVYNTIGQKILNIKPSSSAFISDKSLVSGSYVVKVFNNGVESVNKVIVK